MHSPRNKYNLSPPPEHLLSDTSASADGNCCLNNGNSCGSISHLNCTDTVYDLHIRPQSDINLDTKLPICVHEKLNQQHILIGHELSCSTYYQETLNDEDGCSKERISKTSTLLFSPSLILSHHCSVNNGMYILSSSWEQAARIHHTVPSAVIHSWINCNSVMSCVLDSIPTVLKNPVDVSERKLSLTGLQTDPHVCDRFQVDVLMYKRELLFVLQTSEIGIQRNAFLLNTVDIGQTANDLLSVYLQHIFIKIEKKISSASKFLEEFGSAMNIQYIPDSGSCKTHSISDVSNTSVVSTSENCCVQREGYGMLAVMLGLVRNCHNNSVQDRLCKIIRESYFSVIQQRKSLQIVNVLWSALCIVLHVPLYISHINCFNTSWQDTDKNQILETYNAPSKSSHFQITSIKNINSVTFQKHSSLLADCIPFIGTSRQISFFFNDRKVVCEDSFPLESSIVLQEDTVRAENEVLSSSEQHSLQSNRNKPSNIIMQTKLMAADSVCNLRGCKRDSTDKIVNDFRVHPIIKCQKIRSLSQPSLPTFLLHDTTNDEQFSENSDDESVCLDKTFREYDDIHQENISDFLGAQGEIMHIGMPCNAVNIVPRESTDSNQNVYILHSDNLCNTAASESMAYTTLNELHNESQKLHVKGNNLRPCEGSKLSYPLSPEMDIADNDYDVPFDTTQDTNIFEKQDINILKMEPEIRENIFAFENGVTEREYPNSDEQHLFVPLSGSQMFRDCTVIMDGIVQYNLCKLPDIADSCNSLCNKTCTEETETSLLSECSSSFARGADTQCKICVGTWASDSNDSKIQMERTTTQTHKVCEKIYHFVTAAHSLTNNRCEPYTVRGNVSSPEFINVKESQIFTRLDSPNIMCSNGNDVSHQHLSSDKHTVFRNSCPEHMSNSCKNSCDQKQSASYLCVENCHSYTQVHNKNSENTLNSSVDISVKKCESNVPRHSRCTELKPAEDVAVQTNIRGLIGLENQNGCFVCFKNNHFNCNGFETGTYRSLASKRNFEALDLESVPFHKKPRYDTLKLMYLESDISKLPAKFNSESGKLETTEDSFHDISNEESDFQDVEHQDEVQDTSIMSRQNPIDPDQKVPDAGRNSNWMEDDMSEEELYVGDQITKGPAKHEHIFEWHNQYQFPNASKNKTKQTAHQSRSSGKRSIRVGLSRRAQPLPLHPYYPRQW